MVDDQTESTASTQGDGSSMAAAAHAWRLGGWLVAFDVQRILLTGPLATHVGGRNWLSMPINRFRTRILPEAQAAFDSWLAGGAKARCNLPLVSEANGEASLFQLATSLEHVEPSRVPGAAICLADSVSDVGLVPDRAAIGASSASSGTAKAAPADHPPAMAPEQPVDIALLRQIIDGLPDPVFVHQAGVGWILVNPAAQVLLQAPPEPGPDGCVVALDMPSGLAKVTERMLARVMESGKPAKIDFHSKDGAGRLRAWCGLWTPLFDAQGRTFAVFMHHRDTTQESSETGSLLRERRKLQELAAVDPLTKLHNRRHFLAHAPPALAVAQKSGRDVSIAIFDIDHFKAVNDTHGHAVGDAVLKTVASVTRDTLRRGDILARWGGEEFVICLPTDLRIAEEATGRVRRTIEAAITTYGDTKLSVTASFGVAGLAPGDTVESLIDRADKALYVAKREGRNRVVVAPMEPEADQSAVADQDEDLVEDEDAMERADALSA